MSEFANTITSTAGISYTIIGSGSFGCVYKPALPYDAANDIIIMDPNDNPRKLNTELVSKLGETHEMSAELALYDSIYIVDPSYNYHYPKPILIKINPYNWETLIQPLLNSTCKKIYLNFVKGDIDNCRILEMNYGGNDLYNAIRDIVNNMNLDFTRQIPYTFGYHKTYLTKSILFLEHFHSLFRGVRAFLAPSNFDDKFLHNDIKSMNIVYNDTLPSDLELPPYMKYIDFGLSANYAKFARDDTKFSELHTTFPPETLLLNDVHFSALKQHAVHKNDPTKLDTFAMNSAIKIINHRSGWYNNFFMHAGLSELKTPEELGNLKRKHFADLKAFLLRIITDDAIDYTEFVRQYIQTRDLYGLGYTIYEIMKKIRLVYFGFTTKEFHDKMREFIVFADNLTNFNMFERFSSEDAETTYAELIRSCKRDFLVELAWQESGEMKDRPITTRNFEMTRGAGSMEMSELSQGTKRKRTGGELMSNIVAKPGMRTKLYTLAQQKQPQSTKPPATTSPPVVPELGTREFAQLLKTHDKYQAEEREWSIAIKRRLRQQPEPATKQSGMFDKLVGGRTKQSRKTVRQRRKKRYPRKSRKHAKL